MYCWFMAELFTLLPCSVIDIDEQKYKLYGTVYNYFEYFIRGLSVFLQLFLKLIFKHNP